MFELVRRGFEQYLVARGEITAAEYLREDDEETKDGRNTYRHEYTKRGAPFGIASFFG